LAGPGLGPTRFLGFLDGIKFRLGITHRLSEHLSHLVFGWGLGLGFPLLRHRFSPIGKQKTQEPHFGFKVIK
jgi:hypothetical protein